VRRGAWLIIAAAAAFSVPAAHAQGPRLSVATRMDSTGAPLPPLVRASGVLEGGIFDAALRNGFPVQLHFRLDLYRDSRLLDRVERTVSWDVVIRRDPLDNHYDVVRTGGSLERFVDADALARALDVPYTVDLLPRRAGGRDRYYYLATLEIESLSLTELEEVERWLRGDFGPAVREGGDVGNALGRGARRLLIRFSGLPRRKLEARSETFRQ
jgi:hypothetical protein